jgi:hypothetical protein
VGTICGQCNVISRDEHVVLQRLYLLTTRPMPIVSLFCNFLVLCLPVMLPRYCLNNVRMVPSAPVITGMGFIVVFLISCMSNLNYFENLCGLPLYHDSVS